MAAQPLSRYLAPVVNFSFAEEKNRTISITGNAKRRHQSPEWTILSHVSCFIQGEVIGFQVLLSCI